MVQPPVTDPWSSLSRISTPFIFVTVCLTFLSTEPSSVFVTYSSVVKGTIKAKAVKESALKRPDLSKGNLLHGDCRLHWLQWSRGGCGLCLYGILVCGTPAVCVLALSCCHKGTCTPCVGLQRKQTAGEAFVLELLVCLTASWSVKFKAKLSFTAGWLGRTLREDRYIKEVTLQFLSCSTTLQP